jgi:hypothetical protein
MHRVLWQGSSELSNLFAYGNQSHQQAGQNSSGMITSRSGGVGWPSTSYSPVPFTGHSPNGDAMVNSSARNYSQIDSKPQKQQHAASPPHENSSFGVGIEFASGRRELIVSSLVPGCSAQVNGSIRIGDQMVEAGGVKGLDFKTAREIILGRQGTSVNLTFLRQGQTFRVNLIRGNSDFVQVGPVHPFAWSLVLRSPPSAHLLPLFLWSVCKFVCKSMESHTLCLCEPS